MQKFSWTTSVILMSSLAFSFATGCGEEDPTEDSTTTGGEGGDGGESSGCASEGQGTLKIRASGLPSGLEPKLKLIGPAGTLEVTIGETLSGLDAGEYSVEAAPALDEDPIVRKLYFASDPGTTCLGDDDEQTITVPYKLVPSSNALWAVNGTEEAALLAIPSSDLAASATPADAVSIAAPAGNDVAFDRKGNLWSFGPTSADAPLQRYPASVLGRSGTKAADRKIIVEGIECIPGLRSMAFDPKGNLWLTVCSSIVVLTSAQLEEGAAENGASLTPEIELSGLTDPHGIAFDSDGNLWVSDDGQLIRYAAARLDESTTDAPDAVFSLQDSMGEMDFAADQLAFSADGNLFVTDLSGGAIGHYAIDDLGNDDSDPVPALASLTLAVDAIVDRPAFDDGGGLWIAYGQGSMARLAPADLDDSTDGGSPTVPDVVIDADFIGYSGKLAFFPAAAALPLYHAYE